MKVDIKTYIDHKSNKYPAKLIGNDIRLHDIENCYFREIIDIFQEYFVFIIFNPH